MKKILIITLISILIPLNIKALTGSVNIKCNSNAISGNTSTTCTLSGNSSEGVSSLSAKLSASGNISITNISTSIWQGNGDGGNIELYTDSNKSGNFSIVTFTIKANGNIGTGTINVNNVKFYDASFDGYSIGGKSLNITIKAALQPQPQIQTQQTPAPEQIVETKSNDSSLKSLILSDGIIEFSSDVLEYDIEVANEVKNITLTAESNNQKAQVIIPENLNLDLGINDFEIKVIAEDGTERIYKLHITRLEKELETKSNSSLIIVLILFIISLILNIIFIVKINKNKKSKFNQQPVKTSVAEEQQIVNRVVQTQQPIHPQPMYQQPVQSQQQTVNNVRAVQPMNPVVQEFINQTPTQSLLDNIDNQKTN